jgi:CRISPR-associated Csx10 family RAMP protein
LPPLKERFDRLQQVWSRVPSDKVNMTVFTLTLNSDAIVLDKLWRYCSVLNERVIEREAPGAPLCCLERWFTRTRIISGWNSAHRLPKEDELAIVKGASFLYTTTTDRDILLAWLQQVEEQSIGERRVEGFGQVIACHPFHWEVPER